LSFFNEKKNTTNTAKNLSALKSNQTNQMQHAPRPFQEKLPKVKDEIFFFREGRNA
jgi:hypothetical protein